MIWLWYFVNIIVIIGHFYKQNTSLTFKMFVYVTNVLKTCSFQTFCVYQRKKWTRVNYYRDWYSPSQRYCWYPNLLRRYDCVVALCVYTLHGGADALQRSALFPPWIVRSLFLVDDRNPLKIEKKKLIHFASIIN